MADYAISNVPRRVVYAASGTGPYAFTFEILSTSDISVYEGDALLTLTTDYTVTINANGTGEVNLVSSAGDNITIVGAKNIQRTTDFTTGGDLFANTLNDELDAQTIYVQQVAETAERGLKAPVTDPTDINMTLPRKASRAGKTLAFDEDGNPTVGEDIGNWQGDWDAGTAYTVRDLVKDTTNGNVYRCNTAHTSTGSAPISTNTDSAKWDLVVDAETASGYADDAADSATDAAASASLANDWATKTSGAVAGGEYSAKYHATAAASSASAASTSASNASSSASSASTSASTATTKASDASTSATLAQDWATKTSGEVVTGQGYGAKKYANDASTSASTASTQASNASTSASNASTSASNASTSATLAQDWATKTGSAVSGGEYSAKYHAQAAASSASTATTQASNASTSASNASTYATNASNSASAAATSESNAASSASAAAASYDSFDDRYLGAKTSNPTVDNDGNALLTGAIYFNSVAATMRVWNGSAWQDQAASPDTMTERSFSATAGQTSYTFTGGYRVGYTYVWVNGSMLASADITATNGTTITFTNALSLDDEVRILSFKAIGTVAIADISGLQTALDAKASLTGSETLTNKTVEAGVFTNGYTEETVSANTSTAYTIDLANGSVQILTLTGSCTFTFPTATAGKGFTLLLKQDGTGSRTVTWPSSVKWPSGTAPTITATASKGDKYVFVGDGTYWWGSNAGQNYL